MALYEELGLIDPIEPIIRDLQSGKVKITGDNIYSIAGELQHNVEGSWINIRIALDRNCTLWNAVYFTGYKIISRHCFHCFKVVARPRNLDELFAVHKLQVKMNLPSKAGIEKRPWASHKGSYAAFWYCPMEGGLEGAREHYKMVAKAVREAINEDLPVILKRACTEMEDRAGPSDTWKFPEEQHIFEDMLDTLWDANSEDLVECSSLRASRMRVWINYARERGDPTAEKYYDSYETVGITPTIRYDGDEEVELDMPKRGQRGVKTLAEFKRKAKDSIQRLQAIK